jgi:hypothetical protein
MGPAPTVPKYALTPISSSAGVLDIPFDEGSTVLITLTENVTSVTFSGIPADGFCQRLVAYIKQGGSGNYTINWPSSVLWPSGGVPNLTSDVGAIDCFVFDTIDGGDNILGALAAADFR